MKPWGAVVIAVAVIISAGLFTNAFRTRSRANHAVSVTGSGTRNFESDLISWTANFSCKDPDLKKAYNRLNSDREAVRKFLVSHGAKDSDFVFSSISINKEYTEVTRKDGSRTREFDGFGLTQSVQVESKDVDKFEHISRDVTELINGGVELASNPPEYYFTHLPELKIEMVAAASKDARERAEKIADNAGSHLGRLRQASLGVFQITAQNSSEEFSWRGNYNTNSRHKTATVTMRLEYEVD